MKNLAPSVSILLLPSIGSVCAVVDVDVPTWKPYPCNLRLYLGRSRVRPKKKPSTQSTKERNGSPITGQQTSSFSELIGPTPPLELVNKEMIDLSHPCPSDVIVKRYVDTDVKNVWKSYLRILADPQQQILVVPRCFPTSHQPPPPPPPPPCIRCNFAKASPLKAFTVCTTAFSNTISLLKPSVGPTNDVGHNFLSPQIWNSVELAGGS